jgi:hypothetical protein
MLFAINKSANLLQIPIRFGTNLMIIAFGYDLEHVPGGTIVDFLIK